MFKIEYYIKVMKDGEGSYATFVPFIGKDFRLSNKEKDFILTLLDGIAEEEAEGLWKSDNVANFANRLTVPGMFLGKIKSKAYELMKFYTKTDVTK